MLEFLLEQMLVTIRLVTELMMQQLQESCWESIIEYARLLPDMSNVYCNRFIVADSVNPYETLSRKQLKIPDIQNRA